MRAVGATSAAELRAQFEASARKGAKAVRALGHHLLWHDRHGGPHDAGWSDADWSGGTGSTGRYGSGVDGDTGGAAGGGGLPPPRVLNRINEEPGSIPRSAHTTYSDEEDDVGGDGGFFAGAQDVDPMLPQPPRMVCHPVCVYVCACAYPTQYCPHHHPSLLYCAMLRTSIARCLYEQTYSAACNI